MALKIHGFKFVPEDIWIGLYWCKVWDFPEDKFIFYFYLCLIPCLPLTFSWRQQPKPRYPAQSPTIEPDPFVEEE